MFGGVINGHRAAIGPAPLDDVRDYASTDSPWLATDPVLSPWLPTDLDVVQTGAWTRPDERPLPPELVAFLDAGRRRCTWASPARPWPMHRASPGQTAKRSAPRAFVRSSPVAEPSWT